MPAFPFSVAAFAATELQFCPHALKLRLLGVLQLLRSSQLHHGIKDHLHMTCPSLSFSPAPLRSTSPTFVLLARGVLAQDALARTPLWSTMMKQYPSANRHRYLKLRREQFRTISPVPSSIDLSTPPPRPPSDGHFTPRPEQSDYLADEGWRWKEDI
ncbi:hypothetical protein O181_128639 [Austropuccinia psidii MF-1]|uniref:Uncharacterized protein n=1 Tax=Austropuccinia psidii MF-1 TaxID=1389203 RepID=A0A9Q3L0E5_9BASI|nr:hypothetical protein [Austropuccinia psidii MF-1]